MFASRTPVSGGAAVPGSVSDNSLIVQEIIAMASPDRAMFASEFSVDSLRGSFDTIYSEFKEIARERQRSAAA